MTLDDASCYRALTARDPRFDGVFFVGVTSTRIYCRPVCRARTPMRANCRFFSNAAAAERLGFRPCLRCRPELAPGASPVEATSALAEVAARRIAAGALNEGSVESLAGELAVSARHLRRAVQEHLGVSPLELATTHRLLLAKRLLHDTTLPVTQVAFASGFESARRFNDAFKARYRIAPGALRREAREVPSVSRATDPVPGASVSLALEFRPPLAWDALLAFLAMRATPGVEHVEGGRYTRTIRLGEHAGTLVVEGPRAERHVIVATISPSLLPALMPLLARIRDLFDLDANPEAIATHLVRAGFAARADDLAGMRIPGAVDGFELAVRAVLGQQVSVRGATTLMGRFAAAFGEPCPGATPPLALLTPVAARVARAGVREISALGMPAARGETVHRIAEQVASGKLALAPGSDVRRTIDALLAIRGIGDWTAQYVAMRALRWPDAFPASDLVLRKAAGGLTPSRLARRAEPWRPWRAYAAMALWRSVATLADPSLPLPSPARRGARG